MLGSFLFRTCFFSLLIGSSLLDAAGQTPSLQAPTEAATSPSILSYAEQMPAFPGGEVALHNYLTKQMKYPAQALRRGLSGHVVLQFIVDEEGRVLNPAVVKTTDAEFNAEALRLVWLMPWWTPGRERGQAVRVRCTLPITFTFKR